MLTIKISNKQSDSFTLQDIDKEEEIKTKVNKGKETI